MATNDGKSLDDGHSSTVSNITAASQQLITEKMRIIDHLILQYDHENHDLFKGLKGGRAKVMRRSLDYHLFRESALDHYVERVTPVVISYFIRNIPIDDSVPDDIQSLIISFWGFCETNILSRKREAMIICMLAENFELQECIEEDEKEHARLLVERNKLVRWNLEFIDSLQSSDLAFSHLLH